MKNRDYKNNAVGTISHAYNRGNNREKIFHDQEDYRAFLYRFALALGISEEVLKKDSLLSVKKSRVRMQGNTGLFKLHSFCLMPNHFHLLIEQCGETSVSKLVSQVCTSYAMYVNKKYNRVGHVFQDKFKSVLMENNSQLMWTSAYIHMNPVKAELVNKPSEYMWSSYCDYSHNRNLPIIYTDLLKSLFGNRFIEETAALSKGE